ncbi:MAG TPA: hypothetical protein P5307_16795, partial [Pirellulaceae bacterium]|nr:hypothetical protein [Pirellulaceae bacterium]
MSNDDFDQRRRRTLHIDSARQDEIRRLILFAIFGAFALMLMLGAWSMVYRVEASDEGVVLRFGKQV